MLWSKSRLVVGSSSTSLRACFSCRFFLNVKASSGSSFETWSKRLAAYAGGGSGLERSIFGTSSGRLPGVIGLSFGIGISVLWGLLSVVRLSLAKCRTVRTFGKNFWPLSAGWDGRLEARSLALTLDPQVMAWRSILIVLWPIKSLKFLVWLLRFYAALLIFDMC